MPKCEICGSETQEVVTCSNCGTSFCYYCGDTGAQDCEYCAEEDL